MDELDSLRDEGIIYTRKLIETGVQTVGHINTGVVHAASLIYRKGLLDYTKMLFGTLQHLLSRVESLCSSVGSVSFLSSLLSIFYCSKSFLSCHILPKGGNICSLLPVPPFKCMHHVVNCQINFLPQINPSFEKIHVLQKKEAFCRIK